MKSIHNLAVLSQQVVHSNAKTTYQSRVLIIERYEAGWSQRRISNAGGYSRRTVHKWLKRWREEGEAVLSG